MVKRKAIKIAGIIAALILLIPFPLSLKDGGTVEYRAVLYCVTNYHSRLDVDSLKTGIAVEILGMTVYDNTRVEQW